MHHTHIPKLEELDIRSDYGYENNPGVSKTFLKTGILDRGHEMVLDTAHFYLGDHDCRELERFLKNHTAGSRPFTWRTLPIQKTVLHSEKERWT